MKYELDLTNRRTLLSSLPKTFKTAVEVGVSFGDFSKCILDSTDVQKHYCVDPWEKNPQLTKNWGSALANVRRILGPYGDRVEIVQAWSPACTPQFEDSSFDFIYIDGEHTYEAVRDDTKAWWQKLKNGGVMAGHDYGTDWEGVKRAVDEFVERNELVLYTTGILGVGNGPSPSDGNQPSWVIIKGESND